jgi:purine-binding chemotaxis protein CheW
MRGVINLRGAVVPVVDLSVRFGRAATAINRRSCVVVIESPSDSERRPLGIIVDGVTEVLNASPEQIEQRPEFGSGLRADFVASVLKTQNRFVLILDLASALAFAELETLMAAPAANACI